jgi:hypothetical protein
MKWWLKFLFDTLGQIGEAQATDEGDGSALGEDATEEEATETEDPEDTDREASEDSFVDDPDSVSEEVRNSKEFKGLQRAYQKKLNQLNAGLDKIKVVDQLANDPNYRKRFIMQAAESAGLKVLEDGADKGSNDDLVSIARSALPEGYADAIPGLDAAIAKVVEATVTPLKKQALEQVQSTEQKLRQKEWNEAVARMNELDPEWEDDSDEMGALSDWLKGTEMSHPLYGDRLQILRRLVKGDGAATAEAARRMSQAARNKSQRRRSGSAPSIVDIQKKIAGLKRSDDKWSAAAAFAEEQLSKKGK